VPTALFQMHLTIRPTSGGQAELAVPDTIRDLDYHFVAVKDGGEEGIVRVNAPQKALAALAQDPACTQLADSQADELRKSYPPPRLKHVLRPIHAPEDTAGSATFAVDAEGRPVIDILQTVRSGFYLIDVPVEPTASE
jgi:hypothetical protein